MVNVPIFIKGFFLWLLLIVIFVYLLGGIFIFIFQRDLVYYPNSQDFYSCEGFSEVEKLDVNGTRFYFEKNSNDKVFVFYHGNAGSACSRSYWKDYLDSLDYSYVVVEYAGYSNDSEKPDEKLIIKDVKNVVDFIQKQDFKSVLVGGESLGTSLAVYHSTLMGIDNLLLISPFYSLNEVGKLSLGIYPIDLISTQDYKSGEWIKNTLAKKIEIIHGDKDTVVPISQAKKLFDVIQVNKSFIEVPDAGHNDIYKFDQTQEGIDIFFGN